MSLEVQNTILAQHNTALESKLADSKQENDVLREQVKLLKAIRFSRKTEQKTPHPLDDQYFLFNEPEFAKDEPPAEVETGDPDPVELEQKTPSAPRKRGRKPIPDNIPREIVTIDLPEEKKFCGCGASLIKIGEEITEKLLLVPAKIVVLRIVRPKYACKHCEGTEDNRPGVIIAPMPPQIVKHGIVTPSLLTYIIMNKFHDALPLYL